MSEGDGVREGVWWVRQTWVMKKKSAQFVCLPFVWVLSVRRKGEWVRQLEKKKRGQTSSTDKWQVEGCNLRGIFSLVGRCVEKEKREDMDRERESIWPWLWRCVFVQFFN